MTTSLRRRLVRENRGRGPSAPAPLRGPRPPNPCSWPKRIDLDGREPDDPEHEAHNELHLRHNPDGGCTFRGRLATAPTEALLALLGVHGKPQPPAPGIPDPRPEFERNGDGLAAIVDLAIASSDNPDHGGEKPT